MSTIAGFVKRKIVSDFDETPISGSQGVALWRGNLYSGGNDVQLKAMISYFGSRFIEKYFSGPLVGFVNKIGEV